MALLRDLDCARYLGAVMSLAMIHWLTGAAFVCALCTMFAWGCAAGRAMARARIDELLSANNGLVAQRRKYQDDCLNACHGEASARADLRIATLVFIMCMNEKAKAPEKTVKLSGALSIVTAAGPHCRVCGGSGHYDDMATGIRELMKRFRIGTIAGTGLFAADLVEFILGTPERS